MQLKWSTDVIENIMGQAACHCLYGTSKNSLNVQRQDSYRKKRRNQTVISQNLNHFLDKLNNVSELTLKWIFFLLLKCKINWIKLVKNYYSSQKFNYWMVEHMGPRPHTPPTPFQGEKKKSEGQHVNFWSLEFWWAGFGHDIIINYHL